MSKATNAAAPTPKKSADTSSNQAGSAKLQETGEAQAGDQAGTTQLQESGEAQAGNQAGVTQLQETGEARGGHQAGATQLQETGEAQAGNRAGATQLHEPASALYEVLAPFWFRGGVIKPPARIRMDAADAFQYQEAGVLGTEPADE